MIPPNAIGSSQHHKILIPVHDRKRKIQPVFETDISNPAIRFEISPKRENIMRRDLHMYTAIMEAACLLKIIEGFEGILLPDLPLGEIYDPGRDVGHGHGQRQTGDH
jgi:hypothetical protein